MAKPEAQESLFGVGNTMVEGPAVPLKIVLYPSHNLGRKHLGHYANALYSKEFPTGMS